MGAVPSGLFGQFSLTFASVVPDSFGWLKELLDPIAPYSGALVGLVGIVFGIYQWWWNWESNMFAHLERLLDKDDVKLAEAERRIRIILTQPGNALDVEAPQFSDAGLSSLLKGGIWRSILGSSGRAEFADKSLDESLRRIKLLKDWTEKRDASFTNQLAVAHLVKGNIALRRARMVKPTEAPNPHWYEVARDEFKAAIAEGAEQYRAAATECLGEAYIKLKNFPEARSNFSKLEGIVEDGEQVGVAKWRRADAIRLSHDDDGSGHIASAAGLMNAALETLGAPKSGDRRGLYRLARMHDCHCRIRMKMHNAANATRDSYKAAELNYDAVIKLIDPERLTAWSRWTMQWSDYWHGHRTAELLTQAKNHSGRLKTDYNKHLQRNDTSSSGTDPEKQASEGSDSGDRSHEEPGTES